MLGSAAGPRDLLGGQLAHHLGLPGPNHLCDAVIRVGIRWESRLELGCQLPLGGVAMPDRHPARWLALSIDDVDDAPVGDRGDGEPSHPAERGFVVERGRQRNARAGQEAKRLLAALQLGDVVERVDDVLDGTLVASNPPCGDARVAFLARGGGAVAHDDRRRGFPCQGAAAGELVEREGLASLVEQLKAAHHLGGRRPQQLLDALESDRR